MYIYLSKKDIERKMPFRVLYNNFVKMSIILAIAYVKVLSVLIYISSFSFVFGNYIIA